MTKNRIKILELFGGIGAPRMALQNIGVDIKSIDYVEILPCAVQAYNQMFNNDYDIQDVKSWNLDVDILIHGSPCQDFSKNGLNNINTGRSILYERTLEIIEKELLKRPRVVLWENVPNLLSKRHVEHFNHYIETMDKLGYTSSFSVLNASKYGIPQNRDRVYTVSVYGGHKFSFPDQIPLTHTIDHYIDYDTDVSKYQLSENEKSIFFKKDGKLYAREATKIGYKQVDEYDTINVEFPTSKTRRGRVQKKMAPTITTHPRIAIYYNDTLRMLTAKEHFRLMGFSDESYYKIVSSGITERQISYLAGNSICVSVLEEIFKRIISEWDSY